MSLREIALSGLYSHTKWVLYSCNSINRYVLMLTHKPPYETTVGAELEEAEKVLVESLEKLREAKKAYEALPCQS